MTYYSISYKAIESVTKSLEWYSDAGMPVARNVIAEHCGLSKNHVGIALAALFERGDITLVSPRFFGGGTRGSTPSLYTLSLSYVEKNWDERMLRSVMNAQNLALEHNAFMLSEGATPKVPAFCGGGQWRGFRGNEQKSEK